MPKASSQERRPCRRFPGVPPERAHGLLGLGPPAWLACRRNSEGSPTRAPSCDVCITYARTPIFPLGKLRPSAADCLGTQTSFSSSIRPSMCIDPQPASGYLFPQSVTNPDSLWGSALLGWLVPSALLETDAPLFPHAMFAVTQTLLSL